MIAFEYMDAQLSTISLNRSRTFENTDARSMPVFLSQAVACHKCNQLYVSRSQSALSELTCFQLTGSQTQSAIPNQPQLAKVHKHIQDPSVD